MLRINVQLAESTHSVKWTRYLLSDIAPKLRRVQPFLVFRRPTPPQVLPERPAKPDFNFNPLQWLLDPDKSRTLANRVLAALVQLEAHEENPVFRDDYRQIFIAISSGLAGDSQPFVTASYRMFGVHPDNLWPAIVAKRKAKLGKEYSTLYDENDNLRPSSEWGKVTLEDERPEQFETPDASLSSPSPKKPVQSETRSRRKNVA